VLASLVFRRGRVSFPTLFLAGAILGLYEAYITKVIWSPTWGDVHPSLGGIAVVQTAILVLFWHPVMAFVLPVVVGENIYTRSTETLAALPSGLQSSLKTKRGALMACLALAFLCGGYHSTANSSSFIAGLSALLSIAGLIALGWAWNVLRAGREYAFRELLPTRRQTLVLAALLGSWYLLAGVLIRREAIPRSLEPHLIVWAMYAILFTLLHYSLKRSAERVGDGTDASDVPSYLRRHADKIGFAFLLAFTFTSAIFVPAKPIAWIVAFSTLFVGCGFGATVIVRSIMATLQEQRVRDNLARS
jgi:hypothetical protein